MQLEDILVHHILHHAAHLLLRILKPDLSPCEFTALQLVKNSQQVQFQPIQHLQLLLCSLLGFVCLFVGAFLVGFVLAFCFGGGALLWFFFEHTITLILNRILHYHVNAVCLIQH